MNVVNTQTRVVNRLSEDVVPGIHARMLTIEDDARDVTVRVRELEASSVSNELAQRRVEAAASRSHLLEVKVHELDQSVRTLRAARARVHGERQLQEAARPSAGASRACSVRARCQLA